MKYYLRNYSWLVLESSNPDEIIQDFRNDEELMYLMKTHKKIVYNIQAPLEWLHPDVSYVEVKNFDIDFKNGEIIIVPESNIEYKPLEDARLMWALNKFHKVIYICDAPIDWLPDGVLVLIIQDDNFNHPLNNLPPSLESLTIKGRRSIYGITMCSFDYPLDMLPHGLRHLCIRNLSEYYHKLNNLPAMLEYLELYHIKYRSKNANGIEDGVGIGADVEDREIYYKSLCSSIPNIFIADGRCQRYMSALKIHEFNEYQSKFPKDYKVQSLYV